MPVNAGQLTAFLAEAKRRTYAAQGGEAGVDPPLVPGSRQLEYRDLEWLYRDIYFGVAAFSGQETVSHHEVPAWAMVYAGGLLPDAARPPREVYAFLRRALLLVPADHPYRGPAAFEEGDFVYGNHWQGGPERFRGVERIALAGRPVYELVYAGGRLR
ncbi:MAG TPA: DUF5680 domain-containing protein [Methylomirabilota bacterium]|nr:DUF5680 domain-containing protein [Methylomirabilota bacterium]